MSLTHTVSSRSSRMVGSRSPRSQRSSNASERAVFRSARPASFGGDVRSVVMVTPKAHEVQAGSSGEQPGRRAAIRAGDERRRGADVEHRQGPVAQPERLLAADPRRPRRRRPLRWPRRPGGGRGASAARAGRVATLGRLSPPVWRPDPEFDLGYHVRHVVLAPPGTMRDLLDLVSNLYQDPYDRTRPLWAFYVIDGLEGGRSALLWKLHHALADGLGAGGIADYHLQRSRQAPAAAEVDIGKLVAARAGGRPRRGRRTAGAAGRRAPHRRAHLAAPGRHRPSPHRRVRRLGSPPDRAPSTPPPASVRTVQQVRTQLLGEPDAGRLAAVAAAVTPPPPRDARDPARRRQGRRQAPRRHGQRPVRHRRGQWRPRLPRPPGCPVEALNISFVVSTRDDRATGGNAMTPHGCKSPASAMDPAERFA